MHHVSDVKGFVIVAVVMELKRTEVAKTTTLTRQRFLIID